MDFPFISLIALSLSLLSENLTNPYPLLIFVEGSIIILASITLLYFSLKKSLKISFVTEASNSQTYIENSFGFCALFLFVL